MGRPPKRQFVDNLKSKKKTKVSDSNAFGLGNITPGNVGNVDNLVIGNFSTIVLGTFNQSNARFSDSSKGRQCTAISCVALVHDEVKSVFDWNSEDFDRILTAGDKLSC